MDKTNPLSNQFEKVVSLHDLERVDQKIDSKIEEITQLQSRLYYLEDELFGLMSRKRHLSKKIDT